MINNIIITATAIALLFTSILGFSNQMKIIELHKQVFCLEHNKIYVGNGFCSYFELAKLQQV